jgi:peroxiredoxin
MPYLEKLHQEFGEKGLVILGVNNEERASVERFIREQKVTFTILLDRDGSTGATYDVRAIPRTLIIDSQGTVYADFMGLQPEERLRAALAQLDIK